MEFLQCNIFSRIAEISTSPKHILLVVGIRLVPQVADWYSFAQVLRFSNLCLHWVFPELEKNKETLEDFDSPSLARIGAKLLGLCYQDEHWDTGYRLIFAMHRATVYYYKCSGQGNIGTPIMAMEICLHTHHPDSALQILECKYLA